MVKGNDNGDLVINLSKNLKATKLKNEELLKSNQELKDLLLKANANFLQVKHENNSTLNNPVDSTLKNGNTKKEFSLPEGK